MALRDIALLIAAAGLAAPFYHYLGYPLLLIILARLARPRLTPPAAEPPALSVIVPCYNEAAHIAAKVADLRAAAYPKDRVEIIVVSDGSDDGTAEAAAELGVRVLSWPERRGKPAALNAGAAAAAGDILVFSDANARVDRNALARLAAPFADAAVGAVCGEQVIPAGSAGEKFYWRYEAFLKRCEAAVGSPVGADGSLFALRRALYRRVPEGRVIMDDFFLSLSPVAAGYRLAYAPEALAYEDALPSSRAEFRRKIRIMSGSLAALAALDRRVWVCIPWQLFSHKILRWTAWLFLIAAFVAAALAGILGSAVGWIIWGAQALFYLGAAAAALMGPTRAPLLLKGAHAFVMANAALAAGWFRYLFGSNRAAWEKLR